MYWDTLIMGTTGAFTPVTTLAQSPVRLFNAARGGNVALSNMEGAGAFPSKQTYRIYALRAWLYFRGVTAGVLTDHTFYHRSIISLYWKLIVAGKEAYVGPTWYTPAGGGLAGDIGTSTNVLINNGVPSQEATCKLARCVKLPKFQNFVVECTVATIGAVNFATDVAAITAGELDIKFCIDGLHVRDAL